jgi:RND family efflux transporter MFP subunit
MKNLFVALLVLAVLAAAGFYGWKQWDEKQRRARTKEPRTAQVESRDVRFAINAAGDIGPADQVSVRPEVNGRIAELPVDIGSEVKKGELLFTLDDQDLQIERSTRLTEIEGARLQLEKAKRSFERAQKLFSESLIAREVFDDAKTDHDLAANSLVRAEKGLNQVEDRISKTKIVAPFDCTVLTRPVSVGQAVSGSGGFNSGTEVMTIANLNNMIITAHINQADVARLKAGQKVEITIESVPGLKMEGVIERIAPQATVKSNLKGFSARIGITNIDPLVKPGMTANIAIPIEVAEGVVAVPLGAVFTERGERYVFVKNAAGFERRTVQIGMTDFNYAEITTGLLPGDTVALEQPAENLEADKPKSEREPAGPRGTGRTNGPGASSASRPRSSAL